MGVFTPLVPHGPTHQIVDISQSDRPKITKLLHDVYKYFIHHVPNFHGVRSQKDFRQKHWLRLQCKMTLYNPLIVRSWNFPNLSIYMRYDSRKSFRVGGYRKGLRFNKSQQITFVLNKWSWIIITPNEIRSTNKWHNKYAKNIHTTRSMQRKISGITACLEIN